LAVDENVADQFLFAEHGNAEQRPRPSLQRQMRSVKPCWSFKKALFREYIGDVHCLFNAGNAAKDGIGSRT